ncbi:Uncharacterised protein [Listeria grayi]|uniref:Uncharacterized protein n=2 Tax=Listeria grayi TaxID=1641 RepID=D7UUX3_LISGR|nr:hypothetical protein [Listeria grayi]EFI85049.1 hypothetical protein HMPREF0556_10248 [Listeria grayi DSM 20601]STY44752.1 Uncharacterised protein [Listeria grayi]VEI30394.1 Uncharacterised protein [Listeria grayi]
MAIPFLILLLLFAISYIFLVKNQKGNINETYKKVLLIINIFCVLLFLFYIFTAA